MLAKEQSLGITKKDKKKRNNSSIRNYPFRNNIDRNNLQLDTPNYGFFMECKLGLHNSNFYIIVNHPFFHLFGLFTSSCLLLRI